MSFDWWCRATGVSFCCGVLCFTASNTQTFYFLSPLNINPLWSVKWPYNDCSFRNCNIFDESIYRYIFFTKTNQHLFTFREHFYSVYGTLLIKVNVHIETPRHQILAFFLLKIFYQENVCLLWHISAKIFTYMSL